VKGNPDSGDSAEFRNVRHVIKYTIRQKPLRHGAVGALPVGNYLPIPAVNCVPGVHIASIKESSSKEGRSSRLLRQEFPHLKSRMPTLWTNSYFVATTGGATLEVIKKYVENQRDV
jgi:hypothetical protein